MAIVIKPADLSIVNPQLSALAGRKYSAKYTPVPNVKLPAELQTRLGIIYAALTGTEMQLDDTTIAISAEDGQFNRLYAPKLYAGGTVNESTGETLPPLYIRWGNARIELGHEDGSLVATGGSANKISFKFTKFNPAGRGEDPALEIKVTIKDGKESTVYQTAIALAAQDWKAYDSNLFATTLETDYDSFLELIAPENTGGGAKSGGDVYDYKNLVEAVFGSTDSQTRALELVVTGYREVKTSYGMTYILQIAPSTDKELVERFPAAASEFGLWAVRNSKIVLASKPNITKELTARLVIPASGKQQPYLQLNDKSVTVDSNSIDLDFG